MNLKICSLFIVLMLASIFSFAQPTQIEQSIPRQVEGSQNTQEFSSYDSSYEVWNVTFGGSNIDVGHDVKQTTDGGYILTGYTRSYGDTSDRNIWLIKTDGSGNEEWNTTFGGNEDDEGHSVWQATDGGYIITGQTKSFGSIINDVILIKTDAFGNEEWTKIFGGEFDDEGYSVQQTADGGYIVAGATTSFATGGRNAWLIKTDGSGNEEWTSSIGGLSSDGARSIQQTTDGGYIFTGWTSSYSQGYLFDIWLVKTDASGNEEWNNNWGGTGLEADHGHAVRQTTDGGYIITGESQSYGRDNYDAILIKTDASGNEEWLNTFVGPYREYGHDVQETNDGGYIIVGYTVSYGPGSDSVWVIRTDASGNEMYTNTYGGTSSDVAYAVQQTTDGGYIIVGHTLSYGAGLHDAWLLKITEDPDDFPIPPIADFTFEPSNPEVDELVYFNSTSVDPDGYIVNWTWEMGDGILLYGEYVIHSYAINGTYQVNLTVMDNNVTTNSISKIVAVGAVEINDVNQSEFDRGFRVMPGWDAAQEFVPAYPTLSRVELYLAKAGVYTGDVTFQIIDGNVLGTVLYEGTIDASDVPGPYSWVSVDLGMGVSVTPGELHTIVLKDATDANEYDNILWGWCDSYPSASGGPYGGGWFWFRKDGNLNWLSQRDWDFSFRTYGIGVAIDMPPNACFSWDDADGSGPGTLIDFDAGCSSDDNGIVSYEWDFDGDDLIDDTGMSVSFDPGDALPFNVTLLVTDTVGQNDTVELEVQASVVSGPLLNHSWVNGSNAFTSAYVDSSTDYEVAENFDFGGSKSTISTVVAYGLSLMHTGTSWVEVTPDAQEPFVVRFYDYSMTVTSGITASETGVYELALLDSYGDGWDGGSVSVYVNGDHAVSGTVIDGSGPEYFEFSVEAGDDIATHYIEGTYSSENYYAILDPGNVTVAEEGGTWSDPGASTPGNVGDVVVDEPDWASPVSEQFVDADVTFVDEVWPPTLYDLYRYEVELDTPVNMDSGWVSMQIDTASGSSDAWFLWMNSYDGDLLCWQRVDPVLSGVGVGGLGLGRDGVDSFDPLDVAGSDLACELWS